MLRVRSWQFGVRLTSVRGVSQFDVDGTPRGADQKGSWVSTRSETRFRGIRYPTRISRPCFINKVRLRVSHPGELSVLVRWHLLLSLEPSKKGWCKTWRVGSSSRHVFERLPPRVFCGANLEMVSPLGGTFVDYLLFPQGVSIVRFIAPETRSALSPKASEKIPEDHIITYIRLRFCGAETIHGISTDRT